MHKAEEQLILDFCGAWKAGDAGHVAAFFANNATFHNVPQPAPIEGRAAITRFIEGAFAQLKIDFIVHEIGSRSSGGASIVFTERTDVIVMTNGDRIDLPVAGVAEVRAGEIVAWRDYYDSASAPPPRPPT